VSAEGVGFEPTVSCPTHAFQACRFGRSRIPPDVESGPCTRRRPRRRPVHLLAVARARRTCGTREGPLRAASFRTGLGSRDPGARDPTLNVTRGPLPCGGRASGGDSAPRTWIGGTGHHGLPA